MYKSLNTLLNYENYRTKIGLNNECDDLNI